MKINVDFIESPTSFQVGFNESASSFEVQMEQGKSIEIYDGSYDITPSSERQVLPMTLKEAIQDLIIEPIPNNYGLITYDGSIITVS